MKLQLVKRQFRPRIRTKLRMAALLTAAFLALFLTGPAFALLPPPVILKAPSNLTAVAISSSAIDLAWTDNTINETAYSIERKTGSSDFIVVTSVAASTTTYSDSGLESGTTYTYRVRALGNGDSIKNSQYSNEASAMTKVKLAVPDIILKAPSNLTAVAISSSAIDMAWTDNTINETAYSIERKTGSSDFIVVTSVAASTTTYSDSGLESGTTYTYRVRALGNGDSIKNSQYSNQASAITQTSTLITPPSTKTVLRFYIGSTDYYVDSQVQSMDAAPIIYEGRTLLPIRYVSTPLGAVVDWKGDENKVLVSLNGKTIELWIGQNTAKVNGALVSIDPNNPGVTPIIVPPGRTMLPLRFIAENLGCQVEWLPSNQEVQVTYPK